MSQNIEVRVKIKDSEGQFVVDETLPAQLIPGRPQDFEVSKDVMAILKEHGVFVGDTIEITTK